MKKSAVKTAKRSHKKRVAQVQQPTEFPIFLPKGTKLDPWNEGKCMTLIEDTVITDINTQTNLDDGERPAWGPGAMATVILSYPPGYTPPSNRWKFAMSNGKGWRTQKVNGIPQYLPWPPNQQYVAPVAETPAAEFPVPPEGEEWWKPTDSIRDLVKAGALIAAEIERLQRICAFAALTKGQD